jgi:hypothetical protein
MFLLLVACRRPDAILVEILQPSALAPLSREIRVTFDAPHGLRAEASDGVHFRSFDLPPAEVQVLPLPALYAGHRWDVALTATAPDGSEVALDDVSLVMPATHGWFPEVALRAHDPARMQPGLTLLPLTSVGHATYLAAFDPEGELAWLYLSTTERFLEVRLEGDLLLAHRDNDILLIDWLGRTHGWWTSNLADEPGGIPIDADGLHHELLRTETGNLLTMTQELDRADLPDQEFIPYELAPTDVLTDVVVEVDRDSGVIVDRWSLLDILDDQRIGFDSLNEAKLGGVDWSHANSVEDDRENDAWVVSVRHQDAVVSIDKVSREVNWIAGNHANWREPWASRLLTPIDGPFPWFWHQHAAHWRASDGNLLLFDNGNHRAAPFTIDRPLGASETSSRIAEYTIDADAMTIAEKWSFDLVPPVFSSAMGDADHLENGNVLATYAYIFFEDHVSNVTLGRTAPSIRVVEIDPATNEVVWDLDVWAPAPPGVPWQSYRSTRFPGFDDPP